MYGGILTKLETRRKDRDFCTVDAANRYKSQSVSKNPQFAIKDEHVELQ